MGSWAAASLSLRILVALGGPEHDCYRGLGENKVDIPAELQEILHVVQRSPKGTLTRRTGNCSTSPGLGYSKVLGTTSLGPCAGPGWEKPRHVLTFKVLQDLEQSWALSPRQRQQDSLHGQKAPHPCLCNKRGDLSQA